MIEDGVGVICVDNGEQIVPVKARLDSRGVAQGEAALPQELIEMLQEMIEQLSGTEDDIVRIDRDNLPDML